MTLKDNGYANPSYIRSLMKKVLPAGKAIYPQEVFNLRVRAKMLMKQLRSKKQMLNHIEFKPGDREELFKPLDQVTDDLFDDAVECAKEVYLCYMNDDKNNFNLFAYLDKLASVDRGFTYNISTDSDGKMTGSCWMTSTMRSNFERFHGCVFLDAMRRKTNFHLCPYISIVIVNKLGDSQPVILGFSTSEIDSLYFLGTKCIANGPKCRFEKHPSCFCRSVFHSRYNHIMWIDYSKVVL